MYLKTKQIKISLRTLALFTSIFFLTFTTFAQTKTYVGTGNWSNGANWSPVGVPLGSNVVIIPAGANVTVDDDYSCDSVFFSAGTTASSIVISGSKKLTVSKGIAFSNPTANTVTQLLNVGAGTLECGSLTMPNVTSSRINKVSASTGTIKVNGNLSSSGGTSVNIIEFSGAGKFMLGGTWAPSLGAFTFGTSSFEYFSASTQTIAAKIYNKLILSGAIKNPGGSITSNDSLIISTGATLNNNANINLVCNDVFYIAGTYVEASTLGTVTLKGLIHITPTGTFQVDVAEIFSILGGIKNDGNFKSGNGTYTFATNDQTISGNNLTTFTGSVTVTAITLTANDSIRINGTFAGSGTFVSKKYLFLAGASNTITNLDLSAAGNTVEYSRVGTQTIKGADYKNIRIIGSGINTANGNVSVANSLFIDTLVTFALSTNTLSFSPGCLVTGSGILTTTNLSATPIPEGIVWPYTTVNYSGAAGQTIIGGTYKNLTSSNAARILSSTSPIIINGVFTAGTGAYTSTGSTVILNNPSTQTIPALLNGYNKLILNGTTKNPSGTVVCNDSIIVNPGCTLNNSGSASLSFNSVFYIAGTYIEGSTSGNVSFNGLVHISPSGTFQAIVGESFVISAGIKNQGTFVSGTGVYTFSINNQELSGSTLFTFSGGVTVTGIILTTTNSVRINGNFTGTGTYVNKSTLTLMGVTNNVSTLDLTTAGNTVEYGANGTQTVNAAAYKNLRISGTGTNTAGGAISVENSLFIDSTTTFALSTFPLTFGVGCIATGKGNLTTANTTATPIPAGITWPYATVTYNSGSAQTIVGGSYKNLTSSSIARTLSNADSIFISGVFTPGSGVYTSTGSTVVFNSTGAQNVPAISGGYNNLSLTNGNTKTATGAITVSNNLNLLNNTLFNLAANALTSGALTVTGIGEITTASTLPSGVNWPVKVTYSGAAQTLATGTYVDLSLQGTSTKTANGNITVNGPLAINAGVTMIMSTFILNGTLTSLPSTGTGITTANTSATPIPANRTWAIPITYNSGSSQTIVHGNYSNLTSTNVARVLSTLGTIKISGVFTPGSGVYTTTGSTIEFNGSGAQTIPVINPGYNNLTSSNTGARTLVTGTINVSGNYNAGSNSYTVTGNTFVLNGTNQNFNGTFNNLTLSTSGTKTATANINVAAILIVNASITLELGTSAVLGGAITTLTNNGTIRTAVPTSTSSLPLPAGKTWAGTVEYYSSSAQTAVAGTYTNLIFNGNSTKSMGGSMTSNTSLTLTNGKLNINGNTLTLGGTLVNTVSAGLIGSTTSSLIVNNAVARTLSFDQTTPGTTNVLNNLTNNSGAQTTTLGNTLNIITAVIPTGGTIATGGNLVLISNASGTARIAQGTGSYISGNVKAQRFVPSSARRWRFMASPITNATVNDWRGEIFITGPGTGTTIGTTNSNGFDATQNNSPTMYWYNEALITGDLNTGWTSPTNTTNTLTAGRGYRVFVRGDRSDLNRISDANATQNAVTMDVIGPVNTGDITMPVTFTNSGTIANDGWNLLGNPYPSAFDWNAFNDAGRSGNNGTYYSKIEPTIYVLDATTNAYKFYNALSDAGSITSGIIASGQAFWVKATAASPTTTFKEQFKSASTPTQLFKTTEGGAFKLTVIKDSANSDEVFVKYLNGATTVFDDYDAIKLSSQISISAYGDDAKYLALTTRPLTTINDTIKLYLNVATSGSYNMTFTNSNEIAILDQVWLIDNYTNSIIDLKTTPNYIINVNTTITSSFGGNRFYIVVANNNPVPVKLLTFAGNKIGDNQVALNWSTASEKNSEIFEVEHAIDGKNFSSIGKVKANGNSNVKLNYAFNHNQASTLNYYRLKLINNDQTFEYSNTIMVDFNNTKTQTTDVVKIYPIPATTNLTVELNNQLNITQVLVYNIEGLLMHTENTNSTKVDLNLSEFASGVYVLQIKDELGNVLKRKLIKQ